ncbi:MAG: hypothetical protein C4K60_07020 [Ideonella sp. MAG2]|nr:MAG: hypothetical protein C4K60_07020 [Ideonella sp. MAG2]
MAVSNSGALGSAATGTTVANGATLEISGGISMAESLSIAGSGVGGFGALRNVGDNNTLTARVTQTAASSIKSDAGLLTLAPSSGSAVSGTYALTLGGAGDLSINGPVAISGGTVTKQDAGTLTLSGANTYTGATIISGGVLHAQSDTALGTASGGVTVASGAVLRLGKASGNLAIGAEALTLADGGIVHNVAGNNTYAGGVTLSGDATISVDTGTSLAFTATGANQTIAANKVLTLVANGNLSWTKPLAGSGSLALIGSGSFTGNYSAVTGTQLVATSLPLYVRFYDPTGSDYSSIYGSTPDYKMGFFTAASGGLRIGAAPYVDYTLSGLTLNGTSPTASSSAGSYLFNYVSGLSFNSAAFSLLGAGDATPWTITPKALTLSGLTVVSKPYDGSASANFGSVGTLTGVIAADIGQVSLASGYSASFADKNVGTGKAVTLNNFSLSGSAASNYSLTIPTGLSANITQLASVNWTGGLSGNWFDSANWAGGAVPDRSNVALVTAPSGTLITFNPPGGEPAVNITGLNLGSGTLAQTGGTLNIGASGLQAGALQQSAGTLALTGAFTLAGPASLGGTLSSTGAMTLNGPVSLLGNATLSTTNQAITLGGSIDSDGSPRSLTVNAGTGSVTLTGAVGSTSPLSALTISGSALSLSGDVTLDGTGLLSLTHTAASTFSGALLGNANRLTKAGAGNLTLTSDLMATGTTTISAGTLTLGNGGASGSVAGAIVNSGSLVINRSAPVTLAGNISGNGTLNLAADSTLTLTGNKTSTGSHLRHGHAGASGSGRIDLNRRIELHRGHHHQRRHPDRRPFPRLGHHRQRHHGG